MKMKTILRFIGVSLLTLAMSSLWFAACASGGGGGKSAKTGELSQDEADIEVFPQTGHRSWVTSLAFSPDGTQIVSIGANTRQILLWDTVTKRQIRTFSGHTDKVTAVAFSPDGAQIISGSRDKMVKLWDVTSGNEIRTFSGHTDEVTAVAFSPDGTQIISGTSKEGESVWVSTFGTVKFWDRTSGQEIRSLPNPLGKGVRSLDIVSSIMFNPNGTQMLYHDMTTSRIDLLDLNTNKVIRTLTGIKISTPIFSRDGSALIYSDETGITFEEIQTGQKIRTIPLPYRLSSFALSPNGDKLVGMARGFNDSSSSEFNIILVNINNHEITTIEEGFIAFGSILSTIRKITFSPDGKQILAGGGTNVESIMKLYDTESGQAVHTFLTTGGEMSTGAFSPNGKQLITTFRTEKNISTERGRVTAETEFLKLWDVETGRLLRTFLTHQRTTDIAFSFDGKKIVLASTFDNTAKLWDVATGNELFTLRHQDSVIRAAFSPDGKQIVTSTHERNNYVLKLWDASTGREIYTRRLPEILKYADCVAFSPDGKFIILVGTADNAILWDVERGETIRTFRTQIPYSEGSTLYDRGVRFVTFNHDGTQIATADWNSTVKLWNARTGELLYTFDGRYPAAFSSDGKQLIANGLEGKIRIWDTASGQLISEIEGEAEVFSPGFGQFVSDVLGGIGIFDVSTGRELARFISFDGADTQLAAASRGLTVETETAATTIEGEWLSITPDGYYQASPRGDRYINVRVNNTVSGIDAYRSVFYNPDVVQARLQGSPDPASKANVTIQQAADFIPPTVTIQSPANFSATNTATTNLSINITDQSQPIKNVRVFVNGRSVGRNELTVTGEQKTVNFSLPVQLDPGDNRIEVVAFNGYSETRRFVDVTWNAPAGQRPPLPNLWILAVGVNSYDNAATPRLYGHDNLRFTVTDATRLIESFKTQEGRSYAKVNSLLVTDGTAADIRRSLAFLDQAGDRDVVLVFIAGHGITDREGKFFFLTKDAVFTDYRLERRNVNGNPVDIPVDIVVDASRAISGDEITAVLEGPGKRLLLIDACQSGGVDSDRMVRALQESNAYVFAASQGNESSYESPQWGGGHGVFTYSILNALKGAPAALAQPGNEVRVLSMSGFVRLEVPRQTENRQNPRLYSLLSADFPLAVIRQ